MTKENLSSQFMTRGIRNFTLQKYVKPITAHDKGNITIRVQDNGKARCAQYSILHMSSPL
jgi:hypothetical protein